MKIFRTERITNAVQAGSIPVLVGKNFKTPSKTLFLEGVLNNYTVNY
jgi:hypothetical protein